MIHAAKVKPDRGAVKQFSGVAVGQRQVFPMPDGIGSPWPAGERSVLDRARRSCGRKNEFVEAKTSPLTMKTGKLSMNHPRPNFTAANWSFAFLSNSPASICNAAASWHNSK